MGLTAAVSYDTLSRWGGQELITYAMVKALRELGYVVDVVLLFDGEVDRRMLDIPARRIKALFDIDPRIPARGLTRNIMLGLASLGYDLTINTVYHVLFWPFDIGYLNNPGTYMPPFRLRRRIFIEANRLLIGLMGPRLLLTNSKWTLSQLPFKPRRSGVLYPPIMADRGVCDGVDKEDLVVSIGRIAPDKRTLEVVKAMEAIHDEAPWVKLYVVGLPYRPDYLRQVMAHARHVEFILDASEEAKWNYLCRAKILIHGAVGEHFGLVVAEAQWAGAVPIVHRSGGAWSDIVEYGKFGIGYSTIEEASKAAVKLLKNTEEWQTLSRLCRMKSREYSYEAFKGRLTKYLQALGKAA